MKWFKKEENLDKEKENFRIFKEHPGLVYLDSSCVSLKPEPVVKKINEYYHNYAACAGRSSHFLGEKVSVEVEKAREKARKFFNGRSKEEFIFLRNTSEAINLIAKTLKFSEEYILTTDKEHNSNLLPWKKLEEMGKAKLKVLNTNEGEFDLEEYKNFMKKNEVKLVAVNYSSNLDGRVNPVSEIIRIAHENGAWVLIDAAQAASHTRINVKQLGVDFLACSGHKMLGPSGTGILYGKKEILEEMETFLIGGDTVKDVNLPDYEPASLPHKFEAGLQNYAGIIGLGEAIEYLDKKMNTLHKKTKENLDTLFQNTKELPIKTISSKENNTGIFTFIPETIDAGELGVILSENNICVRTGMFCVHNWFNAHNVKKAVRISLHVYNDKKDMEKFLRVLKNSL